MATKTGHSHVFHRKIGHHKPIVSHGQGIYLWDTDGKRYIDASGGAVVVNVGHGVAEIADAVHDQLANVAFAHATMFTNQAVEELAELLAEKLPVPDARLFFMTSGSEATETAMKFARQAQMARGFASRYKVISRWGAYHGSTLGALGITGKPSMRGPFAPLYVDMPHIPPVYCYRCPFGLSYPSCAIRCADELESEILRQGPETVAAFIAEPIAGATLGAVVPPNEYWPRIREICDKYGIFLIADEVMTGMGRTGRWFAIDEWGVSPDIMCLAKGVSGGYFPLSATAMRGDLVELVWEKYGDFNHGGTFSHQPVGAAAGVAAFKYLEAHDLINHANRIGIELGRKLHNAFDDHPFVGDVRGRGLMWAVEFVQDRATKQPYPPAMHLAARIFEKTFDTGLIVYATSGGADGSAGDQIMIAPPLVVTVEQLDEIIDLLKSAVDAVVANL